DKVLDPTPLTTLPPPLVLSKDEVQTIKDIHKHATYGKSIELLIDDMMVSELNFIEEPFKSYEK
ncbi:hypothetical protein KI387_034874, partial [Taxus chinensis]